MDLQEWSRSGGGYSINFNKDTDIEYVMFLIKQKQNVVN